MIPTMVGFLVRDVSPGLGGCLDQHLLGFDLLSSDRIDMFVFWFTDF